MKVNRYDQHCLQCAWAGDIYATEGEHPPCPICNGETERGGVMTKDSTRVNGDEIPGGVWIENLGHEPVYFDSKKEIEREAKRRGLEPMVRHTPVPGTDVSPHTTRWVTMDQKTLDDKRVLLERVAKAGPSTPSEEPLCVTAQQVKSIVEGRA